MFANAASLAHLVDAPARDALLRSRRGILHALGPAVVGLGLCVGATWLGGHLAGAPDIAERGLLALLEALGLAAPLLVAGVSWSSLRLTPLSTFSVLGVALTVAGLAALLIVPLLAFLRLCAGPESHDALRALAVPAVALVATAAVMVRTLSALDVSRGRALSWAFGVVACAAFAVRLAMFHLPLF